MSTHTHPHTPLAARLAALALAAAFASGCAAADVDVEEGESEDGYTSTTSAPGAEAYLSVDAPGGTLPDYEPSGALRYGPAPSPYAVNPEPQMVYDNGAIHLYGAPRRLTARVGERVAAPPGALYTSVANDTWKRYVALKKGRTTTFHLGRVEVATVDGAARSPLATWTLRPDNRAFTATLTPYTPGPNAWTMDGAAVERERYNRASQVFGAQAFPMGTGLNVLPGKYYVEARYQSNVETFTITVKAGQTSTVAPRDLSGKIRVLPPRPTLPNWAPDGAPPFATQSLSDSMGKSSVPQYDNGTFYVVSGGQSILRTGKVGEEVTLPRGSYRLVLNDTSMGVAVSPGATTTVYVGRIEVTAQPYTFSVEQYSFPEFMGSKATNGRLFGFRGAAIPMGVGLDVLPGKYKLVYHYPGEDKSADVDLPNLP